MIALGLGAVVALVAGGVTWVLVRRDVERWGEAGFTVGPELKFVAFFSVLAWIVAFFVARRVIGGMAIRKREWMLIVPRIELRADGYREAGAPTIERLVEALGKHGYRLRFEGADVDGTPRGHIDARTELAGAVVWLGDERLGASPAGVVLRIGEPVDGASSSLGTVESRDARGEGNEELAIFVIAELDALIPGVSYKPSDSVLTPDDAADLRATLPERPRAIGG